jgi:hypothetical protein
LVGRYLGDQGIRGLQLPGRENGPADAYRHLLWGAELTRRFGPDVARKILETHEIQGDLSSRIGLGSQSPAAAAMDRFAEAEARQPARIDATGRRVPERATSVSSAGGACEVPVRAHSRVGGRVEVGAHCRSRPAA